MSKGLYLAVILALFFAGADARAFQIEQMSYYSSRNNGPGLDQMVRVVNPGEQGSPLSLHHGAVCADIYVFDSEQVMIECCACPVTANGLLELSVLHALTGNPLTGSPGPSQGVITIVSDDYQNCNETSPIAASGLTAWASHLQTPLSGVLVVTEGEFISAPLSNQQLGFLGQTCSFVQYLGSGKGICNCGSPGSG